VNSEPGTINICRQNLTRIFNPNLSLPLMRGKGGEAWVNNRLRAQCDVPEDLVIGRRAGTTPLLADPRVALSLTGIKYDGQASKMHLTTIPAKILLNVDDAWRWVKYIAICCLAALQSCSRSLT
jgi:hypothetical protein